VDNRVDLGPTPQGESMRVEDIHIRTERELFAVWQQLMGPGGFGSRTVWVLFLDPDGRCPGVIMPVEDLPPEPDVEFLHGLASVIDGVELPDGASAPMLLSRPGRQGMTGSDRRWAAALREHVPACRRWPLHLATADHLQVFAPDDLLAAS
jgi:hypothetical protein